MIQNTAEQQLLRLLFKIHPDRVRYLFGYIEGRYERP